MMVRVERRSAAWWAAGTAALGGQDLLRSPARQGVELGGLLPLRGGVPQVHGGVGFKYDVHLYLKRARAGEGFLGDPAWQRERIARRLGL
jgi:hypothetical protein